MPDEPELLLRTARFDVVRLRYAGRDGAPQVREAVLHPGAVVIVPCVDAQHVCLLRNFRPTVNTELWELPAGTLEPGEAPRPAAERELEEETGYTAREWHALGTCYMSPGILREQMHFFLAEGLRAGAPRPEPGELLHTVVVSWTDARRMMRSGGICDAKTLVGLAWADPASPVHRRTTE